MPQHFNVALRKSFPLAQTVGDGVAIPGWSDSLVLPFERAERLQDVYFVLLCFCKAAFPFLRYLFGNLLPLQFMAALLFSARIRRQWLKLADSGLDRRFQFVVKIFETLGADMAQGSLRPSIENQFAPHQDHDLVEELYVLHRVRRQDHGASRFRNLAKQI